MASLNKVMIIGHLGRDPEVSYTPGGMAIAKFSVATTDVWNDKASGEKKEKTEWHRITVFGKQGENCGRYLSKGRQVYIEGKLQTSSYEKDGITRYSTDIIASMVQFLGKQGEVGYQNQGQGQGGGGGYQNQNQNQGGGFGQDNFQQGGGGYQQPPQQGGGFQQPPQQPSQQPSQQGGGFQQDNFNQGGGFPPDQGGFQSPPDDDIPF